MQDTILEITEQNVQEVLNQSLQLPVVFNFYSSRSEQSAQLTQLLTKLTHEHSGQFMLANVDVDKQVMIAAQFGVQAIPTVYLIDKGQPVDVFQGFRNEQQLRESLAKILPDEVDIKLKEANQLLAAEKVTDAVPLLKQAWEKSEKKRSDIALLLVKSYITLQRSEESKVVLQAVPIQDRDTEYQGLVAQIKLLEEAADSPEIQQLEEQVSKDPNNIEQVIQLALKYHQVGRNEDALSHLLAHLQIDLNAGDGHAKKVMLDILAALGTGDELAARYRRKLYSLLY